MARKTFFSFHYIPDGWRAAQVRNAGAVEGNAPVSDNEWEEVTKGGGPAVQTWIGGQMSGKSCAIVLIGSATAGRKWIKYEIEKAWNDGKGVGGVYIHRLKNADGLRSTKGRNPFDDITMKRDSRTLSSTIKTYDPVGQTSTDVYDTITTNLPSWVEEAITIRNNY
jgi:hypothetical protein